MFVVEGILFTIVLFLCSKNYSTKHIHEKERYFPLVEALLDELDSTVSHSKITVQARPAAGRSTIQDQPMPKTGRKSCS